MKGRKRGTGIDAGTLLLLAAMILATLTAAFMLPARTATCANFRFGRRCESYWPL